MSIRSNYLGLVCVFRRGSVLECDITTTCGKTDWKDRCLESFRKLVTFGGPCKENLFLVNFTAKYVEGELQNIRGVEFVREVNGEEYDRLKKEFKN